MFPRLTDYPVVAVDTETTGLRWWADRIFGISIAAPDGNSWYWDVRKHPETLRWLADELPRCRHVVNHNLKFDAHFLREAGVGLSIGNDRLDCTMIRAALIDEHLLTYDLDALGVKYVGVGKDTNVYERLAAMFGGKPTKAAQVKNLERAPESLVAPYAKQDAVTALQLWQWQNDEIEKQGLGQVLQLERDLLPVLLDMERGGVRVDVERATAAVTDITRRVDRMQQELNELAGFDVNPNPSQSIHRLFNPKPRADGAPGFVLCDGTTAETTENGAPSLDAACLRRMKHPAAALILRLRKLIKTRDTFLLGHVLGHHHDGVIHANYNQTKSDNDLGTGTGRLSVNNPALQQIHKRDADIAAVVRSIFLPDLGDDWVCNDWAQMDFRVFAHYVKNPAILQRYADDPATDFHKLAAELTGLPRSPRFAGDPNAKQINLGLVFGMGQGKLAQEMGLPFTVEYDERRKREWLRPGPEAIEVFERYHDAIPGVLELLNNASSVAKSRGYVKTIMGRRIRFPRGQFTHKAGGLIFQGSAADALKVKLVETHDYLSASGAGRLLLNVHDEFDTSVARGRSDVHAELTRIITTFNGVSTPIAFRVPILSDQGVGPNWWEACK